MPTYEYACRDCGEHLEVVQSFRDDPLTTCGACGGRLRKVFSAAGIIFKGSGYYVTDSRQAEKTSSSKGDASTSEKSKDSKKSESKESRSKESTSKGSDKPAAESA